jgi:restriction system protein
MAVHPHYQIEIRHKGLHKYRLIQGTDRYVVERKAAAQQSAWDEVWEKKQTVEQGRRVKERAAQEKEATKSLAVERTEQAQEAISTIEQTLLHTLDIEDRIEWDSLLDNKPFPTACAHKPTWAWSQCNGAEVRNHISRGGQGIPGTPCVGFKTKRMYKASH